MLLLDLFCGAGGAAVGYHRAGFEVVGVDIRDQPRYPFTFCEADALDMLDDLIGGHDPFGYRLSDFDAIHASPPCQSYMLAKHLANPQPKLIEPVRERLEMTGLPYVIENVPGAPLRNPAVLCGGQFGLTAWWSEKGQMAMLRRHRLFESNFPIQDAGPHDHGYRAVCVFGHAHGKGESRIGPEIMGIDWMRRRELCESIPPAYTEYIGRHLAAHIQRCSDVRVAA